LWWIEQGLAFLRTRPSPSVRLVRAVQLSEEVLVFEKGAILHALKRFDEAYATLESLTNGRKPPIGSPFGNEFSKPLFF